MTLSDDDIVSVLQSEDRMKKYLALFDSDPSKIDHRIWMIHFRAPKKKRMDVLNSLFKRELARKKILFSFMPPEMLLARVYKTLNIPYKLNWGSENSSTANGKNRNGSLKKFLKYYNCFPQRESKKPPKNDPYTFDESILEPIMLYSEFRKRWSSRNVPNDSQCQDHFEPPAASTPKLPLEFSTNRRSASRKYGKKKIVSQLPARRVLPTVSKRLSSSIFSKSSSRKPARESARFPKDSGRLYIFTRSTSNYAGPTFSAPTLDKVSTKRSKPNRALFVSDDENTLSDHGRPEDERSWTGSPAAKSPSPCRVVPQTTTVRSPVLSSPQKVSSKKDKSRKITISTGFLAHVSPLLSQANVSVSDIPSENIGFNRVHLDLCSSLNTSPVQMMDVEMVSPENSGNCNTSPKIVTTEKSYRGHRITDQNSTSEESTPVSTSRNLSQSPTFPQVVTTEKSSHQEHRIVDQNLTSEESTPVSTSRNLSQSPVSPQVVTTEKSSHQEHRIIDQKLTSEETTPVLTSRNLSQSPVSPQVVTTEKSSHQENRIVDQKLTSEESTPVSTLRKLSQNPVSPQVTTEKSSHQEYRIAYQNLTSEESTPVSTSRNLSQSPVSPQMVTTEKSSHQEHRIADQNLTSKTSRNSSQSPLVVSNPLVEKSTPVKESCILGKIPFTPRTSKQSYSIDQNSTSEKSSPAGGSRIPGGTISTPDESNQEVFRSSNSSVESNEFNLLTRPKNSSFELLRPPLEISFGANAKAARNLNNVEQREVEETHQVPSNPECVNCDDDDDERQEDGFCGKSNPDVVSEDASILREQVVPEVSSDLDEILVVPNSSTEYSSESGKQNTSGNLEGSISTGDDEILEIREKNSPQTGVSSDKSSSLNDPESKMEEVFNFSIKIQEKLTLTAKNTGLQRKCSNGFILEVENDGNCWQTDAVEPDSHVDKSSELKSRNLRKKTSQRSRKNNSHNACVKKISKVSEVKLSEIMPTSECFESLGNRPIIEVENNKSCDLSNGSVRNSCIEQSLESTWQNSSETLDEPSLPEKSSILDTNDTPASPFRRLLRPRKGRGMDTIHNTDVKESPKLTSRARVGASTEVPKKNEKSSSPASLSRKAQFEKLLEEMKRKAPKTSKASKRVVTRKSSSLSDNVSSQLSVQDESDDSRVFRKPTSRSASQPVQKQSTKPAAVPKPTVRKTSPTKKMKTLVDYVGYKVGKKSSVVGRKKKITSFSDVSEVESQSPPGKQIDDRPSSPKTVKDSDSSVEVTQKPLKRPVRKLFTQLTGLGEIRVPGRRGRKPKYMTSSDSESLWSDQAASEKSYIDSTSMCLNSVADKFNSLKLDAMSAFSPSPPLFSSQSKSKTPPSKVSELPINLQENLTPSNLVISPSRTTRPPVLRQSRLSISPFSDSNVNKNCELMQFETSPTFLEPSSESSLAKKLSSRKNPNSNIEKSSKLPPNSQKYLSSPDFDMDPRKLSSKKNLKRLGKLPNLSISPSSDSSVDDEWQKLSPSEEQLQSLTTKLPTTPSLKITNINKNRKSLLLEMSSLSESLPGLDGNVSTRVTPLPSNANSIYSGGENVREVLNFGRPLPRIDEEENSRNDSPSSNLSAFSRVDKLHHVKKYIRQNRKMLSPYSVDTSEKESDISPQDLKKRRSLPKIAKTRKQRNLWYRFNQDSDSSSTDSFFQHRNQSVRNTQRTTKMSADKKSSELASSPFLSDEDEFQLRENAISDQSGDALRKRLRLFSEDEYDSEELAIMLGNSFPQQKMTEKNSSEAEKSNETFQPEVPVNDSEDVDKLFEAVESKQRKKQTKSFQLPTPRSSNTLASYQEAVWNSFPSTEETARVPAEEKLRETREKLRGLFARQSYENNTDSLDLLQLLEFSGEAPNPASDEKMNSDLSDTDFL